MHLAPLVCAGLLGWGDAPAPAPDVAAEYQQIRAAAGRAPADQVRLALWCESHGLTAEWARHLSLAVLADPGNAVARGVAGLVARDGRWVAPDSVAQSVQGDAAARALLAEYDRRRSKAPYTADSQWALGQWADEQGLKDQARAHFTAVTRLDPSRELAWKRLGFKKRDGRWTTDAQAAAAKAEVDTQRDADHAWKPLLEKYRGMLAKPNQREEAQAALLAVTDPRAVASIARVFGTDRVTDQQMAVGLLGQIESPHASRLLAALAVFSSSPDVRRTALETLRQRDPRDFVGFWISLIRDPIKYEVRPVGGPGSPGTLFIAGQKANTQRVYSPMEAPNPANYPGMLLTYDANGLPSLVQNEVGLGGGNTVGLSDRRVFLAEWEPSAQLLKSLGPVQSGGEIAKKVSAALDHPQPTDPWVTRFNNSGNRRNTDPIIQRHTEVPIGQMMIDAQMSAGVARRQLAGDVSALERSNAQTRSNNDPILLALQDATGQNFGEDSAQWSRWWIDQQGYASRYSSTDQTPTFVENVPIGFTPTAAPFVTNQVIGAVAAIHSCFGAGTPVRTVDGTKAVEQVERGDLVLVQDTVSGALSYQPVLAAFHNPPSSTYRIKLGDDEVVATGIHRFWRAGKGWVMVRDLKAGDSLRVLGGVATVVAVEGEKVQPVFNLEVAAGRSFFVGRVGALVHDNSLVEATPSPFDAAEVAGPVAAAPR